MFIGLLQFLSVPPLSKNLGISMHERVFSSLEFPRVRPFSSWNWHGRVPFSARNFHGQVPFSVRNFHSEGLFQHGISMGKCLFCSGRQILAGNSTGLTLNSSGNSIERVSNHAGNSTGKGRNFCGNSTRSF